MPTTTKKRQGLAGPFLGIAEFHAEDAPAQEEPIARALRFLAHCQRAAQAREELLMRLCRFDADAREAVAREHAFAASTLEYVAAWIREAPPSAGTLDLLRRMLATIDGKAIQRSALDPNQVRRVVRKLVEFRGVRLPIVAETCADVWLDGNPERGTLARGGLSKSDRAALTRATEGREPLLYKVGSRPLRWRLPQRFAQGIADELGAD